MVKTKYADRSDWGRVIDRDVKICHLEEEDFKGYVSLIKFKKITKPLYVDDKCGKRCVFDNGYKWLQIWHENKNHCITMMINTKEEIVQWYIDISRNISVTKEGIPTFEDLFLDVVATPAGEISLLDEDELEDAFNNGEITKQDFDLAYREVEYIMKNVVSNIDKLRSYCEKYYRIINEK